MSNIKTVSHYPRQVLYYRTYAKKPVGLKNVGGIEVDAEIGFLTPPELSPDIT